MFIAYVVVAVVFSVLLVVSGRAKIVKDPQVTTTMTGLGVPLGWFVPLALLEFAAAAGLLLGIAYRPLGIAAAIGALLYFIGAVLTHLRARDAKGSAVPAVIALVSVAAVVLGVASA